MTSTPYKPFAPSKEPLLDFAGCRKFQALSREKKAAFVASLSEQEAKELRYLWPAWGRANQLAPSDAFVVWIMLGGRGMGKTRGGAEFIRGKVERGLWGRIALIGRTAADVRDVMIGGDSGLLAVSHPDFMPKHEPTRRRLVWPNGAIATTYSAEEPNSLRGPQHDGGWCLTGDTLVLMADGSQKRLAEVAVNDYVMTRKGSKRVTGHYLTKRNARVYLLRDMDGRSIIGTGEHPVWVEGKGFIPLSLLSKGMSLCVMPVSSGTGISGTNATINNTTKDEFCSIVPSGSKLMVESRQGTMSIIKTATRQITGWKTWNYSRMESIAHSIIKRNWLPTKQEPGKTQRSQWRRISGNAWNEHLSALFAAKNTIAHRPIPPVFAQQRVWKTIAQTHLLEKLVTASIVVPSTRPKSERKSTALANATGAQATNANPLSSSGHSSVLTAIPRSRQNAPTLASVQSNVPKLSTTTIDTVESLVTPADVYDIAVEDAHEFFANGILVHNCDEPCAWKYLETWDQMMFGLRLGQNPQVVATTTPRPIPWLKRLLEQPTTRRTGGSTYENLENLAPTFRREVISRFEGTNLGLQELMGEVIGEAEGALWNRELLEKTRVREYPPLVRIVVGVDPATTSEEGSDETGIVVVGLGIDGHLYVLADYTLRGSPLVWAEKVVWAYHYHEADRIIGEANNGGDLIETVIRTVRGGANVSYKKVHAARGKIARAEPVVALYEQHKEHHVGALAELENEQCNWVQGQPSPNRMDALVWASTELGLTGGAIPLAGTSARYAPEQANPLTIAGQMQLAQMAQLGMERTREEQQAGVGITEQELKRREQLARLLSDLGRMGRM